MGLFLSGYELKKTGYRCILFTNTYAPKIVVY